MLPVTCDAQRQIVGWLVNSELAHIWEKIFLVLFDELSFPLSAENKDIQNKAQEIRSTGGCFKPEPPYKGTSNLLSVIWWIILSFVSWE